MPTPTFSFEFFPPRSEKAADKFWPVVAELATLNPQFMTVTFGAGGSSQEGTEKTVQRIVQDFSIPTAMHLTYINFTIAEIGDYLDGLWGKGVRHIVALRGDMPPDLKWPLDKDSDYFQYTSDFVEYLKARHPFEISVGAYPEKHPDAPDLSADIEALKIKCDAGADRAITQFFFDNDLFYRFVDAVLQRGIQTPIVPGILPIGDFEKMKRFAQSCGANVPNWLQEKFEGLEDKPEEAQKIATDIFHAQIEDLTSRHIPHLHIYSMNKAQPAFDVIKELGLNTQKNIDDKKII